MRSLPGLLEASAAQLVAGRGGRTSAPGLRPRGLRPRRPGETPSPAHFAAALVRGMRARWPRVAAEQLRARERRGEARGRQPRPEVSAAEVCVAFPAAALERVGGTSPPLVLRGCGGHTYEAVSPGRESERCRRGRGPRRAKAGRVSDRARGAEGETPAGPRDANGARPGSSRGGWAGRVQVEVGTTSSGDLAPPPGAASRGLSEVADSATRTSHGFSPGLRPGRRAPGRRTTGQEERAAGARRRRWRAGAPASPDPALGATRSEVFRDAPAPTDEPRVEGGGGGAASGRGSGLCAPRGPRGAVPVLARPLRGGARLQQAGPRLLPRAPGPAAAPQVRRLFPPPPGCLRPERAARSFPGHVQLFLALSSLTGLPEELLSFNLPNF